MSFNQKIGAYVMLQQTWSKQPKYSLSTEKEIKENFGSFSISAAVRPSSCCQNNRKWANPYDRQPHMYGIN